MNIIFMKELKRTRTSLAIWSVFIGLMVSFGMLEYPVISQYTDLMDEVLLLIPKIGQILFGVYQVHLNEPIGYYVVMHYWTGLIVFTHAAYMGASIISKEERDKTAEFLFTKPYPRRTIITAKILAGVANILIIAIVTTLFSMISMMPISMDAVVYGQVLVSCAGMFLTQCVLMSLGVLCSAIFRTYKTSVMAAMCVLAGSYFLMFFVQYIDSPQLNFLSPLAYFSVSEVVKHGLHPAYILLAAVVFTQCLRHLIKRYRYLG